MTDLQRAPGTPQGGAGTDLDELRAEAMAWGRRPRRFGSWYATEHILRAMRAYGWTIIVGALGQPIVYLLGLAIGLAALIQQDIPVPGGGSVPYLVFVAPALLMTATMAVASEEFTYPVLAGFKWRRYFYGLNASPLSSPQIANGVAMAASARMFVAAAAYYLFIWAFGLVFSIPTVPEPATAWLTIPIGILVGLSFGLPIMAYAASIEDDRGQFALIQRFLFMPMFLFSGTFYPLTTLPIWLQWIGWISPLWHATELGRIVSYGSAADAPLLWLHLGYLVLLAAVGYAFVRRAFSSRLAK